MLGNKKYKEDRPFIGNNVEFTLGAKAIGGVHIGDNSIICPNSVVIKDIPENCIASGVPVCIIKKRLYRRLSIIEKRRCVLKADL